MSMTTATSLNRPPILAQTLIERRAHLPDRLVEGQGVVVSTQRGEAIIMNRVGYLIWQSLAHPTTVSQLADTLVKQFAIAPSQALIDVQHFITRLHTLDLVSVR